MLKSFKAEIAPTEEQTTIIKKNIGTCRFVYNFYLAKNRDLYSSEHKFMTAREFSVWLNNTYIPQNPEYIWIKQASSKSIKKSLENGHDAFRRFFNKQTHYPKFKKKGSNVKMYFVKNHPKDCICERHRIKIPTIGWIKIKEKGYIPTTKDGYSVRSGTISIEAGRFYVSALVDVPDRKSDNNGEGLGIDLGIKEFAIVSNGMTFANINKCHALRKLEKKYKREQRKLSRKLKNLKKGESTQRANYYKQILKLEKLRQRISNIRNDYINKTIAEIVKTKPSFIAIEDLYVSGMTHNKNLAHSILEQCFGKFRIKLKFKCKEWGIELRIVDRWYPSSKLCHNCGCIKSDLRLSDRIYKCSCGYEEDRDYNASLNIRDSLVYVVA